MGKLGIAGHSSVNKNTLRAKLVSLEGRHGRMNSKLSCFIRSCRNYAAYVFWFSADNNRFSAIFRMVKLFNRSKKSVKICMKRILFVAAPASVRLLQT